MGGLYDILESYRQQNDPRFVYEGLFEEPAYTGPYIPGQEPPFTQRAFMDMTQRGPYGVPQNTGINTIPMDLTQIGQSQNVFTDDAGIDIDESYEEFPEVEKERSKLDPRRIGGGLLSLLGFIVNPIGAVIGGGIRSLAGGIQNKFPGARDFVSDFKSSPTLKDFFQARRDRKARAEAAARGEEKQRMKALQKMTSDLAYGGGDRRGGFTGPGVAGVGAGTFSEANPTATEGSF